MTVLYLTVAISLSGCSRKTAAMNENRTEILMSAMKVSIELFKIRMSRLPESLEELRDGPNDEDGKERWIAPIITEIPTDGWDNPIVYTRTGSSYQLRSAGADGELDSKDDITVNGN
jgi:general secretion pathway protein G